MKVLRLQKAARNDSSERLNNKTERLLHRFTSVKQISDLSDVRYDNLPEVRHHCPGLLDSSCGRYEDSVHVPCLASVGSVGLCSGSRSRRCTPAFATGQDQSSADNTRVSCLKGERLPGCGVWAVVLHSIQWCFRSIVYKPCTSLWNVVLITCKGKTLGSIKTQTSVYFSKTQVI